MKNSSWYRKPIWTAHDKEEFYTQLNRSKNLAPQYIKTQVAIFIASGKEELIQEAIEMLFWILKKMPNSSYAGMLYFSLAKCYENLNNTAKTIEYYQICLEFEVENTSIKTEAAENFALFVAKNKLQGYYKYVDELLVKRKNDFVFPRSRFMVAAAYAIINANLGERQTAKSFAKMALEEASKASSNSIKYPEIGLVEQIDNETLKLLNAID